MNLEEILVANGASLILLIILFICRHNTRKTRRMSDKIFSVIIMLITVGCVLECVTFLLDGRGHWLRPYSIFFNSAEYVCTASAALFWALYTDQVLNEDKKILKNYFIPFVAAWVFILLLLIPNAFLGFLFSVDYDCVYSRQPVGYVYYAFFMSCYIFSIILYYRFRISKGRTKFFPIWMFLTPLFISFFISVFLYGVSVSFLGSAIGLAGLYMNIQNRMSMTDSLTGLYNRSYIEHYITAARENKRYVYSGIMLDVDHFKKINDTFGHSVGDDALVDVADILSKATGKKETVFRYAGDEFIIMMRLPQSREEELEPLTIEIKENILREVKLFNKEGATPYKLQFSMGYALYDVNKTDDVFFQKMDEEMYREKEFHKTASKNIKSIV